MGQPVFSSPVPQLVSDIQPENVDQGNLTTSNIVSTGHAESVEDMDDCLPDKGDVATTPPPPPPDPSADQNLPLPPVPPAADPNKSNMNVKIPQDEGKVDTSCNSDGALSDLNGKFYKVDKELFVLVK